MKAVVDTDILSEIMRAKNETVLSRSRAYVKKSGRLTLSVLTVFETMQGLYKAERYSRAESFLRWLPRCEILAFDLETAKLAGEIAGTLLRTGRPIGVVDIGLAATAIRHGRVLVTGNTAHFEYVRAAGFPLVIQNWRDP